MGSGAVVVIVWTISLIFNVSDTRSIQSDTPLCTANASDTLTCNSDDSQVDAAADTSPLLQDCNNASGGRRGGGGYSMGC